MNKSQSLIVILAVAIFFFLFNLPRTVVENEVEADTSSEHGSVISNEDAEAIGMLHRNLQSIDNQKNVTFADSLSKLYLKYGMLDSAKLLVYRQLKINNSVEWEKKASFILYSIFERTSKTDDISELSIQLKSLLESVLKNDNDPSLRNKLAMLIVLTEQPMKGVMMLREVLEEFPNNREAILNLGLLALKSGQNKKSLERFQKMLELDSTDFEAQLYKALAYQELGNDTLSDSIYQQLIENEKVDPSIKQAAKDYKNKN